MPKINPIFQNKVAGLKYAAQLRGKHEGFHIAVIGGLHGNEPAGVQAMLEIQNCIKNSDLDFEKGRLSLILGNPQAYEMGRRFIHRNLNRAFDAELLTDYESQRAQEITQFLQTQRPDFVLDLHSVSVGDFRMVAFMHNHGENLRLAQKLTDLDLYLEVDSKIAPGSLIEACQHLEIPALAIECGNNSNPASSQKAMHIILRTLFEYKMLKNFQLPIKTSEPRQVEVYTMIDKIQPKPGFRFLNESKVTSGTSLKKAQIYAKFAGGEYQAQQDCYIFMPDKRPQVNDFDAGFLCLKRYLSIELPAASRTDRKSLIARAV